MKELAPFLADKRALYALKLAGIGALVGIIAALLAYPRQHDVFFFYGTHGTLVTWSMGSVGILLTVALSFAVTLVSYRQCVLEQADLSAIERFVLQKRRSLVGRFVAAMVSSAMLATVIGLITASLGFLLLNLQMSLGSATFLTALYCAVLTFRVSYWASRITAADLIKLCILTFLFGLMASSLLSDDREWWRRSISYLGYVSGSNQMFRVAMVCMGLLLLSFMRDVLDSFEVLRYIGKLEKWQYQALAFGGMLIGAAIIGVGWFPIDVTRLSNWMHGISIYTAGGTIILGMVSMRYLLGHVLHPTFFKLTYALLVTLGICTILFINRTLNFAAYETIAFTAYTLWIYYLHEFVLQWIRSDYQSHDHAFEQVLPERRLLFYRWQRIS